VSKGQKGVKYSKEAGNEKSEEKELGKGPSPTTLQEDGEIAGGVGESVTLRGEEKRHKTAT